MLTTVTVAKTICAFASSGFCSNVGGDLGCKSGRGVIPHHSHCVATDNQLKFARHWDAAEAVMDLIKEPL